MKVSRPWIVAAALALLWLLMLVAGGGPADRTLLLGVYARDIQPLERAAIALTNLGSGKALLAISAAAALAMILIRRPQAALLFLLATLSGRLLVIGQKLWFARLRPEEHLRLVEVSSLSFPSGHAANSTMVFVGLALLLPPPRYRWAAIAAAAALAALIGLSRPMLGVHWPTDVIAGWAFGALWLLLWWKGATALPGARRWLTRS